MHVVARLRSVQVDDAPQGKDCLLAQFRFGTFLEDGQLLGQMRARNLKVNFVQRFSQQSAENDDSHQR